MSKINLTGVAAFAIVLLSMPLGHAAMIIMEHMLKGSALNFAAFLVGVVGVVVTIAGGRSTKDTVSTLSGFFGGLLVWTGWVEFGYIYFAHKLSVAPIIENGEVVTKPEYLLLMSSVGFWAIIMLAYIFRFKSRCVMYSWIQRKAKIECGASDQSDVRNSSFTTFMESIMVLWSCYLVLMFAYDKDILGDHHPVTMAIAVACLLWSIWLFRGLMKIRTMGSALRYAIPTVMIFWTFVEVMGRIGLMEEIWVDPLRYTTEIGIMIAFFVALLVGLIFFKRGQGAK